MRHISYDVGNYEKKTKGSEVKNQKTDGMECVTAPDDLKNNLTIKYRFKYEINTKNLKTKQNFNLKKPIRSFFLII